MSDWLALAPGASLNRDADAPLLLQLRHCGLVCLIHAPAHDGESPAWQPDLGPDAGPTVEARANADEAHLVRHAAVPSGGLVLLVDDVVSAAPQRWQWHLDLTANPVLATHARRCDAAAGGVGLRFYWLVPEGIRAWRAASDIGWRVTLETTQPTREARLAVAILPWDGEPPLPSRFRSGDRMGIRVGGVGASVGATVAELPAIEVEGVRE